jgi:hypothetical protein
MEAESELESPFLWLVESDEDSDSESESPTVSLVEFSCLPGKRLLAEMEEFPQSV